MSTSKGSLPNHGCSLRSGVSFLTLLAISHKAGYHLISQLRRCQRFVVCHDSWGMFFLFWRVLVGMGWTTIAKVTSRVRPLLLDTIDQNSSWWTVNHWWFNKESLQENCDQKIWASSKIKNNTNLMFLSCQKKTPTTHQGSGESPCRHFGMNKLNPSMAASNMNPWMLFLGYPCSQLASTCSMISSAK